MSQSDKSKSQAVPSYYDAHYGNFRTELYSEIRREAFGEDIGQNSWLTAGEQDKFPSWLGLATGKTLLDVACGAGGPALRIVVLTGCTLTGVRIDNAKVCTAFKPTLTRERTCCRNRLFDFTRTGSRERR